ncbi:unnamed protein product [Ilex paraguariensis]|uniref:Uncharacterized protein n=1 Tax=Ilex paraguariensis TaxID=185542 RepID=A0ABC8T1P6_9AQUA
MAAAVGRGSQTMSSFCFKPMLRKAYHRKSNSTDMISDTVKVNGEEVKTKTAAGDHGGSWWIPDDRTGIYCPKGQEKVLADVPLGAGKDSGVHYFFNNLNHG